CSKEVGTRYGPRCSTSIQECTATRGVPRQDASAKACARASSLSWLPSTPTTTGPSSGTTPRRGRTISTGHLACAETAVVVEPSSMLLNAPRLAQHHQGSLGGLLHQHVDRRPVL